MKGFSKECAMGLYEADEEPERGPHPQYVGADTGAGTIDCRVPSRRLDLVSSMRATMRPGTELIPPSRHTFIEVRPVCQRYNQDIITFVLSLYLTDSSANKCVSILRFIPSIANRRLLSK